MVREVVSDDNEDYSEYTSLEVRESSHFCLGSCVNIMLIRCYEYLISGLGYHTVTKIPQIYLFTYVSKHCPLVNAMVIVAHLIV